MLKSLSKHQQIRESLIDLIKNERLQPGDRILSQSQLARKFKVNPITIGKVLAELCEENLLYRENGRGTFVGTAVQYKTDNNIRKVCLALPGENLDSMEYNPFNWQYIQQWLKTFMECMGESRLFSPVIIPENDSSSSTLDKISEFDITFFLNSAGYKDLIRILLDRNISCPVSLGGPAEGLNCLSLPFDLIGNTKKGISYLLRLNYRKIAFICPTSPWFDSEIEVYKKKMSEAGISYHPNWIYQIAEDEHLSDRLQSLDRLDEFDAIYAATNLLAVNVYEKLKRDNLRVPEDIGLMAGAGLEFMVSQPPYLTAMLYPHKPIIIFALAFIESHNFSYKKAYSESFTGGLHIGKTCREIPLKEQHKC